MSVDTPAHNRDLIGDATTWIKKNWNPELRVGDWWRMLGENGWAAPALPAEWFGHDATREEALVIARAVGSVGAVRAPVGVGLGLAAPLIAAFGTVDQKRRYLRDIVTGRTGWCQLFSEPGAGSDLAGLTTRADRDGSEWVINGQKVWTSNAMYADVAILLARTNWDAPKHRGITFFLFPMDQPGVEVRPLREMTGRAHFNEVFLTDARAPDRDVVGGVDNGWAMARATLAFERSVIGAGGGGIGVPGAEPGSKAGALARSCTEFTSKATDEARGRGSFVDVDFMVRLAGEAGKTFDPLVRQDLAWLYSLSEIERFMSLRSRALRETGRDIPGAGNLAKLARTRFVKGTRDVGLRVAGPAGALHSYPGTAGARAVGSFGEASLARMTDAALFAQASSIYGGSDEIQRNVVAEQALGLPKDPAPDRDRPFRELPRN